MTELFGIDFGTTNSATVGLLHGTRTLYGDLQGQPYPSIVAIDRMTGSVRGKGREVWQNREAFRAHCEIIASAKTSLCTGKSWRIGPRTWTPEQIVTEILLGLKDEVQRRTQGKSKLTESVISIPVGFAPEKRKALRGAAELAGIKIVGFLSEPTAAVYKHFSDVRDYIKIAVFDWGGGTLDISVVELRNGYVHELASEGIPLGGDNLDLKIAEWAHNRFKERAQSIPIPFTNMPPKFRESLIVRAEDSKRHLSNEVQAPIRLNDYGDFGAVGTEINRIDLENLLKPEIERAIQTLKTTIVRANLSDQELDCVLMVGGSSKLSGLYDRICNEFACEIIGPKADADWHIAHGAALRNRHGGKDILSKHIGLELSDKTFFSLYGKDEAVTSEKKVWNFGVIEDTDTANFVFVESDGAEANAIIAGQTNRVGHLSVPTYGFLRESIKLETRIDEDLVLYVNAKSTNTDKISERSKQFQQIHFSYKLPESL